MSCKQLINEEDGIARVAGNRMLYARLLKKFLKTDYISELRLLAAQGDLTELKKSLHTIKGVAANLSLELLHDATLRTETSLKDGELSPQYLSELYSTYEKTTESIKAFE